MATPLTGTPTALLGDQADIETAVPPGFQHLEKYAIPRFTSVSLANQAFTAAGGAQLHELRWITAQGHQGLEIFDGAAWVEFGLFARLRTFRRVRFPDADLIRTSTLFTSATGYSVTVPAGVWRVELDLQYSAAADSELRLNFTFPGTASRMSFGLVGRGNDATGALANSSTVYTENSAGRTSGDVSESTGVSGVSTTNAGQAYGAGVLSLTEAGTLQMQYARGGSSGEVNLRNHTVLSVSQI